LFGRTGLKFKCGRVVLRGGNRAVYLLTAWYFILFALIIIIFVLM
jgi:hypothetical protein